MIQSLPENQMGQPGLEPGTVSLRGSCATIALLARKRRLYKMAWKIQRGNVWYVGWRDKNPRCPAHSLGSKESEPCLCKDRYASTGLTDEGLAETERLKKELSIKVEGNFPLPIESPSMTLNDLIVIYLKQADLKPRTIRANEYCWKKFQEVTGALTIEAASQDTIVKDFKGKATKLAPAYLSMILRDMRKLLKFAVKKGLIKNNPFDGVTLPEQEEVARFITEAEEEKLLSMASPLMQRMIRVELATGLREGQLASLDWSQIDTRRNIIKVSPQKRQKKREIPIFDDTLGQLGEPQEKGAIFPEFEGKSEEAIVWAVNAMWSKVKKGAGIKGRLRFHDLRHTCASRLATKLTPFELRDFFGWSSVALTDRYVHTRTEEIRAKMKST